jgi:uncharacterized phage protein (TIGR01671 family)
MREIKFRAWDKINKEMINFCEKGFEDFYTLEACNHGNGIYFLHDTEEKKELAGEDFELMQYTGLKDKNGKEIYEGDIVKTKDGIFKVYWNHYVWAFDNPNKYIPFSSYDWKTLEEMVLEVIGNIYENSNLLKEKK